MVAEEDIFRRIEIIREQIFSITNKCAAASWKLGDYEGTLSIKYPSVFNPYFAIEVYCSFIGEGANVWVGMTLLECLELLEDDLITILEDSNNLFSDLEEIEDQLLKEVEGAK